MSDLAEAGIKNSYPLRSSTEIISDYEAQPSHPEVCFVGHVMSWLSNMAQEDPLSHHLRRDFWARVCNLAHPIAPSSVRHARSLSPHEAASIQFTSRKIQYRCEAHGLSLPFRGEILQRLNAPSIAIYGGILPIYASEQNAKIDKDSVHYFAAQHDPVKLAQIYKEKRINLNITSLQFDNAVINRVIDIAGAGGFVLTDWRPGLAELTEVADSISYRSPEELNEKIAYYLDPSHDKERQEISEALHNDIMSRCTYQQTVSSVLEQLEKPESREASVMQIDLGCGIHKPEGYLGVDRYPAAGVDRVADLNQRFPFASNSVDRVRAHDVIEHLTDRIHTMNEIWRICKPGGIVDILVPSTDGRGAFQDPTHVSFWNLNSFLYYSIDHPAYLNLCKSYGFKGCFRIIACKEDHTPGNVVHVNIQLEAIKDEKTTDAEGNKDLVSRYTLKQINVIASALQTNEDRSSQLSPQGLLELVRKISKHPSGANVTIIVDIGKENQEAATEQLSDLMLSLILEDFMDSNACVPSISIYSDHDGSERSQLNALIHGRITNDDFIEPVLAQVLPPIPLDGSLAPSTEC
ncbi:glycosyltransferase [Synechococcus sp. ATX 2A4]|uniref:glycosyltransferase family protein n=1 Tax=Synechococcus sp. ATX 2A4 TaxID=2823727 RepID=UPI0020CC3D01|nr:glycosyltransferase [Synechococcus sp. ATX 2A4]MCP9885136.1 glycosyltransferase [Synechococcus sp. ATX 2A4]